MFLLYETYMHSNGDTLACFNCFMHMIYRFLRCSPFDEYKLWKAQVDNGSKRGGERLNILTRALLLRRTKDQLDATGKPLVHADSMCSSQNLEHFSIQKTVHIGNLRGLHNHIHLNLLATWKILCFCVRCLCLIGHVRFIVWSCLKMSRLYMMLCLHNPGMSCHWTLISLFIL